MVQKEIVLKIIIIIKFIKLIFNFNSIFLCFALLY